MIPWAVALVCLLAVSILAIVVPMLGRTRVDLGRHACR